MLNKTVLIGRLTKEPNAKQLTTGTYVASYTLAVNRNFKNKNGEREADFIPMVAWGKTAELCGQYLHKGMLIAVSGRIQTRTYVDDDGKTRYVTEVVAEEIVFLEKKKTEEEIMSANGFEEEDLPF